MSRHFFHTVRAGRFGAALIAVAASSMLYAQDSQESAPPPPLPQQQAPAPSGSGGWRRVGDPPRAGQDPGPANNAQVGGVPAERDGGFEGPQSEQADRPDYGQNGGSYQNGQGAPPPPNYQIPSQLTIKPGTFITVRINQTLSSDRNQPGDSFSATLSRPLVVDGVVIAQPGETIGGRVSEAEKAGRAKGTSRLVLQLTDLTLVDGQQLPIQTQLVARSGGTSKGQDAGAIVGTSAVGAAIGAIAGEGSGAGIGAAAGAVAGTAGVLLTRGHSTVVYPESLLTFRIEAPVSFSTERSAQAFRYVDAGDYDRSYQADSQHVQSPVGVCGPYGCPPPPPVYYGRTYYGPAYYGSPYPYYYGPGFSFFVGPRFYYGPRFYGGRGYYRGYRR
jgi:hypothetical protein